MKPFLILFLVIIFTGCSPSLKTKATDLMEEASILEPPQKWQEKVWNFKIYKLHDKESYSFIAKFKKNKFPYYSCLMRDSQDPWLELEILEWKDGEKIEKDLVAMYVQKGAYIEILLSGDLCGHYDILMTKITDNKISGYLTGHGSGHMGVYGLVNLEEGKNP